MLARSGYDVSVQYGANQPQYDLIAVKDERILLVSVKGSQDGGWMLAVRDKNKDITYHEAADRWLARQRPDLVYIFVQFLGIPIGGAPKAYIAQPPEIAAHLKMQRGGKGYGSLQENKPTHQIPEHWGFSKERINSIECLPDAAIDRAKRVKKATQAN